MNRTALIAASLLSLVAASAAQADSPVPGSETAAREHDDAQHSAVASGAYRGAGTAAFGQTRTFGYPSNERSVGLVPGSEAVFRAADDAAIGSVVIGQGGRSLTDAFSIGEDGGVLAGGTR